MDWQQIREVMEKDPLDHQRRWRWSKEWLCIDCAVFVILISLVIYFFVLTPNPNPVSVVFKDIEKFVLPAGVLALIGTAVTVFYKVRLAARARNRQVWIDSVRKHIHTLISNCSPQRGNDQERPEQFEAELSMLALLINPGERVHRSLITIVRLMYGIHDNALDRVVYRDLGLGTASGEQVAENGESARDCPGELKVWSTRLSNVLLKREWERVKHVK